MADYVSRDHVTALVHFISLIILGKAYPLHHRHTPTLHTVVIYHQHTAIGEARRRWSSATAEGVKTFVKPVEENEESAPDMVDQRVIRIDQISTADDFK
jgi:hypothetical protein